jgi:hypothetical protein
MLLWVLERMGLYPNFPKASKTLIRGFSPAPSVYPTLREEREGWGTRTVVVGEKQKLFPAPRVSVGWRRPKRFLSVEKGPLVSEAK